MPAGPPHDRGAGIKREFTCRPMPGQFSV